MRVRRRTDCRSLTHTTDTQPTQPLHAPIPLSPSQVDSAFRRYVMSGVLEFVALARSIRRYRDLIHNTLDHGLSNARSEATNTHLRALTKRAYGFHSPDALIAMAMLTRGGLCPPLPGRAA